jgi:rhodanese-related sulfurtransferase
MNNKGKQNTSILIVLALFLIILTGLIFQSRHDSDYAISAEENLSEILYDSDLMRPENAIAIINSNHPQFRFIDLRTPEEYNSGHLESAINIPFKDLLSDEYIETLDQEKYVNVLYSSNELLAKEATMLLKQLGYLNNRALLGGYYFITTYILDGYETKYGRYPDDKAAYDFKKIAEETKSFSDVSTELKPPKKTKKIKKVETEVAGGC